MAVSKYILSIDQGTTSTRAFLFDDQGQVVKKAQRPLSIIYPQDGCVEQDAQQIWQDVLTVCQDVIDDASILAAIGITNQRETTIVWDRQTGTPVYNAIVWQDRRTHEFCDQLKQKGKEDVIRSKTGLVIDPYFSASKVRWILKNTPNLEGRDLAFGTIDSWLIWKLTGGQSHVTDATNASRTQIYNIHDGCWDDDLLQLFDIPKSLLPEVKDCADDFGMTDASLFGAAIPITGVAGDQQAALIGQCCFSKGMVKSTYGTGCFVLMNTGDKAPVSQNGLLTTIGYRLDGKITYALEGAIFNAGTAIQWLRDDLDLIDDAGETEKLASSLNNNGGVYFVPAFTGLGAPHWRPDAKGIITGLQRSTGRAHFARAALEAQGYQTNDLIDTMASESDIAIETIRVDGGMVANDFVCQFIADMCHVAVERPDNIETTVFGAAYLAGMYVGIYPSLDKAESFYKTNKTFTPKVDEQERRHLIQGWDKAVKQCLV